MPPSALYIFVLIGIGTSRLRFRQNYPTLIGLVELLTQFYATIYFTGNPPLPHSQPTTLTSLPATVGDHIIRALSVDFSIVAASVCSRTNSIASGWLWGSVVAGRSGPGTRWTASPSICRMVNWVIRSVDVLMMTDQIVRTE